MDWNESKAYGNVGENAVELLIKSMPDWKCIKFGVENHINTLKESIRGVLNPTTYKIKSMPDFFVINRKESKTFFVEAKYLSSIDREIVGESWYLFKRNLLDHYLKYWPETKLIIVHPEKPYFIFIDLKDVKPKTMCKRVRIRNKPKDKWNFAGIEKDIKLLFPDLTIKIIKKAIELIPSSKK